MTKMRNSDPDPRQPRLAEFDKAGFSITPSGLDPAVIESIITQLGEVNGAGRRGMLRDPIVKELATSPLLTRIVCQYLPVHPRPVRAIYFDKSPDANWLVAWHQDLTIAVTHQAELPGFGPWSQKDGIIHVQPPASYLEQMVTVRLHLDHADESNGALKVIPGSHRHGRLTPDQIEWHRTNQTEHLCQANRGDILLMRPLILHASARSTVTHHRRILHIEYAGCDLPPELQWNESA